MLAVHNLLQACSLISALPPFHSCTPGQSPAQLLTYYLLIQVLPDRYWYCVQFHFQAVRTLAKCCLPFQKAKNCRYERTVEECRHKVAFSIITPMFLVHWDEALHCLYSYRALLRLGEELSQLPKGYPIWEALNANRYLAECCNQVV